MIFGSIGLCERVLSTERAWVRYASDSSYWLYLAHLPLVIALQAGLAFTEIPVWAKFLLVTVVSTLLLLASYQLLVRYTPVGTLLNGKRVRPRRGTVPGPVETRL